ncbi:hypothetical protein [Gardnerella vaginalis]
MSVVKDLAAELHNAVVERVEARCLVKQAHHALSVQIRNMPKHYAL